MESKINDPNLINENSLNAQFLKQTKLKEDKKINLNNSKELNSYRFENTYERLMNKEKIRLMNIEVLKKEKLAREVSLILNDKENLISQKSKQYINKSNKSIKINESIHESLYQYKKRPICIQSSETKHYKEESQIVA